MQKDVQFEEPRACSGRDTKSLFGQLLHVPVATSRYVKGVQEAEQAEGLASRFLGLGTYL